LAGRSRRAVSDSSGGRGLFVVGGVFERVGAGGEQAKGFDGGVRRETVVAEFAIGRLEMFGVTEVFGGIGHAEFAFEEGDGVIDLIHILVGLNDGGFGDEAGDFAGGEFAEDASFTEAGAVAADGGVGIGKGLVVEDVHLFEAGENVVDGGRSFGTDGQFFLQFADGKSAAAEEAGGVVPESVVIQLFRNSRIHLLIVATLGAVSNI
jgi:hypothetical protein